MSAVIAILKNLLKNPRTTAVLGAIAGLIVGLIWAWVVQPVQWTDGTPEVLRSDLQEDYLRMAIDSYRLTGDVNAANRRYEALGSAKADVYSKIQGNPGTQDPAAIQNYGLLIQRVEQIQAAPSGSAPLSTSAMVISIVLILVLLAVVVAIFVFLRRLLGRRSDVVTPVMQAAEISRSREKTNFESLGLATPITQTMTTYVLGDDLYDESFSIATQAGEFLGEYGVGVSETVGVGEPKKVTALEVWLFDKNDIKTATKVLMSEHAYNDPNIRARLEPK